MASKLIFLFSFLVLRISDSVDLNFGADPESTKCEKVLIREFGSQSNFRIEYMRVISNCSKDFDQNSTIREKCEIQSVNVSILEDIFQFTMALDLGTKTMMYMNVYCAICNGEKEFYQFPPHLQYHIDETTVNNSESTMDLENIKKYYPISEHTQVLGNLRKNDQNELVSFNEAGLKFKFHPFKVLVVPKRSQKEFREPMQPFRPVRLPFCPGYHRRHFNCNETSSKVDNCYFKDEKYSNIFNSREIIEKLNKQVGRPSNASFCPEKYIDSGEESSFCKYENENGYSCWWNKFLTKGVDYAEGENGEIFFVDNYTMINISRDEYTIRTGMKNVLYLCGVNKLKKQENQYCIEIINSMQCLLRRVSIFCVIVYLSIKGHRRLLSNLMEKITYSYYVTLLLMYIREEITEGIVKKSCFLEYSVYRYFLQSYTFWIMIATSYLWVIVRTPGAERAMNQEVWKRRKIFLSMCFIGWVLPAIFTFIFYLFEATPSCPVIPGYISLKTCKSAKDTDPYFWFILVSIIIISTVVLIQFMATCYYYQCGDSKEMDDEAGCSDWKNRMIFFFKIAYSMWMYLLLMIAAMIDPEGPAHGILLHLWSFHGTLIFFLYSFKATVLKSVFSARESPEGAAGADQPNEC